MVTNFLKIAFSLYAVYAVAIALHTAVRHGSPRFWLWAGVSLCFLPVAWGLIREKKWAWNSAVGLLIFRVCWVAGQLAGLFLSNVVDTTGFGRIALRAFAGNIGFTIGLLTLLILARAAYRSVFAEANTNQNNYVRPVLAGSFFLLMGLLALVHPIAQYPGPILFRMIALLYMAFLWTSASLCFFEYDNAVIRNWAKVATAIAAVGIICSLSFYTYFALLGILVGILQLSLGSAAIFTMRKPILTPHPLPSV